jgi:hypothetical protein
MKYTVTINEKSKTVVVNLNGYEGVAKCCETDTFNLQTGIELALERARVAEANAKKPKVIAKPMGVMELVKALEKALPKGQMVIVGNGEGMTARQKEWLHSLTDCKGNCSCEGECYTDEEIEDIKADAYEEGYDEGYDDGHSDGYDEGYADAVDEYESDTDADELAAKIREVLEDYEN